MLSKNCSFEIIAPCSVFICDKKQSLRTVKLMHCGTKKDIAFPLFRAHSDFTAINLDNFLVSVLAALYGEIFNL
jgi:hypothetical protein